MPNADTSSASDDGDQTLFVFLSWVGLLAYPAAVYYTWRNTLVDHEVSPWITFAPSVPLGMALGGCGSLFKRFLAGPVLLIRKQPKLVFSVAEDKANSERMMARTWKMLELALLSLFGWYVIRNAPFLPRSLGGPGEAHHMFPSGRRFVPCKLAAYHAVRFAYLLEWWILEDGLGRPYLTMHHVATSILVCCAVFAGFSEIGSIIMFLHDLAGLPVQILIWMQQVRLPSIFLIVTWLANVTSWAYLMLYCFPVDVLLPSFDGDRFDQPEWKIYWAMFLLLLVHHVYVEIRLLAYVPRFLKSPTGAAGAAQEDAARKND